MNRGFYLSNNKSEIIIQNGLYIYILDGDIDFSEKDIIEICKTKLSL